MMFWAWMPKETYRGIAPWAWQTVEADNLYEAAIKFAREEMDNGNIPCGDTEVDVVVSRQLPSGRIEQGCLILSLDRLRGELPV